LTIGGPSNSFLIPYFARESGFINISGGYVLGPEGANAAHVRGMIARSTPRLRVLLSGDKIHPDSDQREPRQSDVDDILGSYDLRVDLSDCATINVLGLRSSAWRAFGSSIPAPPRRGFTSQFTSCRLLADTRDRSQEANARRAVDIVLNRLEDACPMLFQPARPQTEYVNQTWLRFYGATDLTAWVSKGDVKFISATRSPREILVGREEAWARGPLRLECGRKDGSYFAGLPRADK
jgi:hypothetical protein